MGYGTVNPANGQTTAGGGPSGQPEFQHPSQGMPYGSTATDYGRAMAGGAPMGQQPAQPGMQPPQGMGYGPVDPFYGQAGMQSPPQAACGPMGTAYYGQPVYVQPGFQPPPAMGYPGSGPTYAAGPSMAHPDAQQAPPAENPADQAGNAEHYSRIADVVRDIANGEQPDVSKIAAVYSGFDTQFWKGALVGAVLAVLLTSDTVKTALAGTMGAIFGALKKDDAVSAGDSTPEPGASEA
jgi:hypothetical protein